MKSSVILQHMYIQEHWPSEVWMKLVNIYIPVEVNMFGIGNCQLLRVRGLQEYLFQIPKTSRSRFCCCIMTPSLLQCRVDPLHVAPMRKWVKQ